MSDPVILDLGLVMRTVAARYQTSVDLIRGRRSTVAVIRARHVAMFLAHRLLPVKSSVEIGRAFHRDHTTVLAAVAKVEAQVMRDAGFAAELRRLEIELLAMAPVQDADMDAALRAAGTIAAEVNHALIHEAARDPKRFLERVGKLFGGAPCAG
ncbi:MAG: hypothetical protein M0006_16000 [Magnetospirillum sp.]|nr:hypothetical protein [Magnetospirillum sp.]